MLRIMHGTTVCLLGATLQVAALSQHPGGPSSEPSSADAVGFKQSPPPSGHDVDVVVNDDDDAEVELPPLSTYPATWQRIDLPDPILPVFDAPIAVRHDMLALVGGFDARLEATPIIQMLHPRRGWLPVSSQMIEARGGHTMTDLGDGRVFIVGGVQGRIGGRLTPVLTCEVLDPLKAGSEEVITLDEPLIGHTAHAWNEGSAIVIGGSSVRIWRDGTDGWAQRIALASPRRHHASVLLSDRRLLVIGGDKLGTIEVIDLSKPDSPSAAMWPQPLDAVIHSCAAIELRDGRVLVVGGIDAATGASVDRTWLLDPRTMDVAPGPLLQIEGGVARARLFEVSGLITIVGGERVSAEDRGPCAEARVFQPGRDQVWSIESPPAGGAMRNWYRSREGWMTFLGEMQFTTPEEAAARGVEPGVSVTGESWRLRISRLPVLRD